MLSNVLIALVPGIALLGGTFPLIAAARWRRARHRSKNKYSPLTREMLRPPGFSLQQKVRELDYAIDADVATILTLPLIGFSIYLSLSHFGNVPDSLVRVLGIALAVLCLTTYATRDLMKRLNERGQYELGMEGEQATAQELDQLMLGGCRVFHDVPMTYGNIDHVVISQSGVYAINTKAIRKSGRCRDTKVVVDNNRNVIQFPDRTLPIPTDQLQTESGWLARHLSSSVGEKVDVEPMLALPGWFIADRIGRGPAFVFNPTKPQKFFIQSRRVLSAELVQRIAHQIEQICRNVTPSQKESKGWTQSN